MVCSIDITMMPRPYQIDQENVQKSLFKALFIFMNFRPPLLSTRHNSRMRNNFEIILLAGSCH